MITKTLFSILHLGKAEKDYWRRCAIKEKLVKMSFRLKGDKNIIVKSIFTTALVYYK
jgi:hypothetical protein